MESINTITNPPKVAKQPVGFEFKKRCPKCSGSLYVDQDFAGIFESCLQCGFTKNLDKEDK